jgi:glycosyltransferase involved in cell wall biosynthesis
MRTCLVVTVFERPDALGRALGSVLAQRRLPDEVVVADDGSGPEVARVVADFASRAPFPVDHVRQKHDGFRAGRARNLAIASTSCPYLVLVDGDMVLHGAFLADHVAAARPHHWTQGVRIPLDGPATRRLVETGVPPRAWAPGIDARRRVYALHVPALRRPLERAANGFVAIKSCNQALWRDDLLRVNGFDEELTGWGSEDKELCARLSNLGVRRQTLVFSGIAWHLDHRPASRASERANRERWRETVRSGRTRCICGIDQHLPR